MTTVNTSFATRLKVGLFTIAGLFFIGIVTVMVNDHPYWWRSCQLVKINVEDATGLKTKSPIRSLGIEIGFLKYVMLSETHVTLGICITAPVEVLPSTRAYIRAEGFLGDKFVELKPVKYTGSAPNAAEKSASSGTLITPGAQLDMNQEPDRLPATNFQSSQVQKSQVQKIFDWILPSALAEEPAHAETPPAKGSTKGGREIPVGAESQDVQHLVNRVDELVHQMSGLTSNLKDSINPEDLRRTMRQLNTTLENASRTLSPEGGLNRTAQRTLAKLEDSIEQLRDIMTRINKGEGSLGRLLNDPVYADQIRLALINVNRMLNKVQDVQFVVDIGGVNLTRINGGRGWFQLGIWPNKTRYYLLGIAGDSRGRISNTTIYTTAGGVTQTTQVQTVEQTGILLTGMVGKVYLNRIDVSLGALYGDAAVSIMLNLGPTGDESLFQFRNDLYVRNAVGSFDGRTTLIVRPIPKFPNIYGRLGFDSVKGLYGEGGGAGPSFFYGGGITFDDEDIKLLFTLK